MRRRKLLGAFSIAALVATLLVMGASSTTSPAGAWVGPSSPTNAAVPMDCVATAPVVGDVPASQDITLTTTAPNKVEAGEQFDIFSQAGATTAPTNASGFPINHIKNFEIRIPLPSGATRVNEQIVAGTGFGFGSANIVWDGANNRWVFTVSGPISGGASFQFPQLRIRVQATGAPGATIEPRLGGNSKTNFGFSLVVNTTLPQPVGTTDVPTACWPKPPNPAFSTTQIIPVDTTGPAITINSPADFGTYGLDLSVPANYSCNDGANGTGVATCTGTVANGAPIDTSSVGTKSFTVNATDLKGNASSKTVTYEVVDLPLISGNPTWANEGSPATFTVTLSKPWPVPVSVSYATVNGSAVSPADYVHTANVLTFAPGEFTKNVVVPTVNDAIYQGELHFALQLSSPVNGLLVDTSIDARILDGEFPAPEASGKTVDEAPGATVDFDVRIPFDPVAPVTVAYQTVNGTAVAGNDYQATAGSLVFNPGGPLSQTVSVPVIDDSEDDGHGIDFFLEVTNHDTGEEGVAGHAVIIDNDGPPPPPPVNIGAKIGDVRVVEGDSGNRTAWLIVRLDDPAPGPITFTFTTVNGTATATGKDFKAKSSSLSFKAGQVARAVNIPVVPDTNNEGDEEFYVDITGIDGGNVIGDLRGVVTIEDDDAPTAPGSVVSLGDATTYEHDSGLGIVDIPITVNKKRNKNAPDYEIAVQVDIVYGTASPTDVEAKKFPKTVTFAGGVNKNVQIKVRGDTVVEPNEQLTFVASTLPSTPPGVTIGRPVGTLTILDNDGAPSVPRNVGATTSTTKLGHVDLRWSPPTSGAPTSYEWRVATDGTLDDEPWSSTDTGRNTHVEHDCGAGVTCQYQVRAVNAAGPGPASPVVSAVGLEDLDEPELLVFTPKPGANTDSYTGVAYNGLIGTALGDAKAVTVNVYGCANCTNVAPVESLAGAVGGAGWSAAGSALAPGVYTVQVLQTDWAGNTAETVRVIETRNGVFVSATGNDGNPGTAALPKQTIGNGLATAVGAGRPEVVVGQGTYAALIITAGQSNKAIRGGFDQYAGWSRPGNAGVAGTPNQDLTNIESGPTAALINGATGVVLDSLRIKGSNAGQPAGTSIYGVRAIGGASVALQNAKVISDPGVAGTNGTNGLNGNHGNPGGNGNLGGEACESGNNFIPSIVAGGAGGTVVGGNSGGAGGVGDCRSNGGTGGTGAGGTGAGAGGSGGASSGNLLCTNAGAGAGGGGGAGGSAGTTPGAGGGTGTAGATWAGNNGGTGSSGTAGRGGGGGGGGGGHSANFLGPVCDGYDAGGSGGGGGAGGTGGTPGTGGTAGGGSFGVYANNSSVTIDALSTITAGAGGKGGDGGNGGSGGNGGTGGRGGSVTNAGNSGQPTGNSSPTPCGFFGLFPACYADGGPGGGGGGGGAGGGASGGGGGSGGPSAAVLHTGTGTISVAGSTSASLGGAGGAGGTAGANGLRGEPGATAPGAWDPGAIAGGQGGLATGTPQPGANGAPGFSCRIHDNGVCVLA